VLDHEVYDVITRTHITTGHLGKNKTSDFIHERYWGITRKEIEWLVVNHCATCLARKVSTSRAPLRPIKSSNVFERVEIDLIDMRSRPDGEYNWILHCVDHFSKFSVAFPLKTKESEEVAKHMANFIAIFGPMGILQCDNGGEFKGALGVLLKEYGIKIVRSRPRHPQTNGAVESGNGTLKTRLDKWMIDNQSTKWTTGLLSTIISLNSQTSSTTRKSPYQIVFKQRMRDAQWLLPNERDTAYVPEVDESDDASQSSLPIDPQLQAEDGSASSSSDPSQQLQNELSGKIQ
jgi:hypothetical protein